MKIRHGLLRQIIILGIIALMIPLIAACGDDADPTATPAAPAPTEATDDATEVADETPDTADDATPEGDDEADAEPTEEAAAPVAPGEIEQVSFMMDTNYLPKHGIFFAAQGLGFYEKYGLDVQFMPGTGSLATSNATEAGTTDFGFADFATMVSVAAQGADIKQLAVIHAVAPHSVVTVPETGITSMEDLVGKQVAGEAAGSTTILFPLALELCGIDPNEVEMVTVDSRAKSSGLLAGNWDAFVAYSVSDPPVMIGQGYEPVVLQWADCGFAAYSNGLITKTDTIENDPDLVQRFVTATLEGVQWACENPEAAAENTLTFVEEMDMVSAEAGIDAACGIIWTPEAEENGMGYMDPAQVEHTIQIAKDYLELEADIDPETVYTNEFLPGIMQDDVVTAP